MSRIFSSSILFVLSVASPAFGQSGFEAIVSYGHGDSLTSSTRTPAVEVFGFPDTGHSLYVQCRGAAPRKLAILHCSTDPANTTLNGLPIYIDLNGVYATDVTTTDSSGYGSIEVPIANDPALVGTDFYLQYAISDGWNLIETTSAALVNVFDTLDNLLYVYPVELDLDLPGVAAGSPPFEGEMTFALTPGANDSSMSADVQVTAGAPTVTFNGTSEEAGFFSIASETKTVSLTPADFLGTDIRNVTFEIGYDELWVDDYVDLSPASDVTVGFFPVDLLGSISIANDPTQGVGALTVSMLDYMPPDASLLEHAQLAFSGNIGFGVGVDAYAALAAGSYCMELDVSIRVIQDSQGVDPTYSDGTSPITQASLLSAMNAAALGYKTQCCIKIQIDNKDPAVDGPGFITDDETEMGELINRQAGDDSAFAHEGEHTIDILVAGDIPTHPVIGTVGAWTVYGGDPKSPVRGAIVVGGIHMDSESELTNFLMHELGHALGLPTNHDPNTGGSSLASPPSNDKLSNYWCDEFRKKRQNLTIPRKEYTGPLLPLFDPWSDVIPCTPMPQIII